MQFKQLPLFACLATQAYAATWTLKGYSNGSTGDDTNCDAGTLHFDEVINQSGNAPQACTASGVKSVQSINWNSGGSTDALDSFFVCFYTDFNCPKSSAVSTLPEGNFGCQGSPSLRAGSSLREQIYFSVKASSDSGC